VKDKIDNQTIRLLIRTKLLLHHAIEHALKKTEIDYLISFQGLDTVIENLLRQIISYLDFENKIKGDLDRLDLANLASQLNNLLISEFNLKLPYLSDIKLLRKTRNLIQHGLVNPGIELERFVKITKKCFSYCIVNIFKLSDIDLDDYLLINNVIVKNHLKKSKDFYLNKKYFASVVASRDAFENTWYEIIKSSEINHSSLSAIIEAKKDTKFYSEFFARIKNELILTKLNIDSKANELFEDYLNHIPHQYRADKMSIQTVMQREWNENDALFCYEFAFDFILKYQNAINEPLYRITQTFKNSSNYKYGNIEISKGSEGHLSYLYSDELKAHEMLLLYVNNSLKHRLEKLIPGKKYLLVSEGYLEKRLESLIKYSTILHNISFELGNK